MHWCVLRWDIGLHIQARCPADWEPLSEGRRRPLWPGSRWWGWCLLALRWKGGYINAIKRVFKKLPVWFVFQSLEELIWSSLAAQIPPVLIILPLCCSLWSLPCYGISSLRRCLVNLIRSIPLTCTITLTREVGHVCTFIHHTLHEAQRLPL